MKKILTGILAISLLAVAPLAVSTSDAEAGSKTWKKFRNGLATGVGVGVGLGIVNSLTRPRQPQQPVYVQPAPRPVYIQPAPVYVQPAPVYNAGYSQAHYNYCGSKFKSYHFPSNTYQPYHGPRRLCHSPY